MRATAQRRSPTPTAMPPSRDAPRRIRAAARPSARRALAWGLGLSLLLHLLLLLIASRTWLTTELIWERPASPPPDQSAPTMRAYRLRVMAEGEPEVTLPPRREEDAETAAPRRAPFETVVPSAPEHEAPAPEPGTAAERLRPRLSDPRLWNRPEPPPEPEKSDIDRARERVYARIQQLNDSLAAEGEAAMRATDWTHTDKDGKRWGISPGKIHLGGLTLPLPVGFSPPPDKAAEARERARKDEEVGRQSETARHGESFDERAKAIRERKEQERKEKKSGSGATGSGTSGSSSGSTGSGSDSG